MADKIDSFEPGTTNMSQTRRQIHWAAQVFTATKDYDITAIELRVAKTGSPGPLYIEIQGVDGDNKPDGNILMAGSLAEGSIPASEDWSGQIAVAGASPGLTEGNKYAIVLNAKDSPGAGNEVNCYGRQTSEMYAGGDLAMSSDSGSSWIVYDQDLWFRTYGEEAVVGGGQGGPAPLLVAQGVI